MKWDNTSNKWYCANDVDTNTDTNTNAATICSGTNKYLDGDGNCDTIDLSNYYTKAEVDALIAGSDGTTLDLVYGIHSSDQCTNLGGSVVSDSSGNDFCRFSQSYCPSGWSQYNKWTTTSSKTCSSGWSCECTTGSHSWSSTNRETCSYPDADKCYDTFSGNYLTCYANIDSIGCY